MTSFFTALAGSSGALVGLMFVALSVARDQMLGEAGGESGRARSGIAPTAFLMPLIVSLLALIPTIGIPIPAGIAGCAGTGATAGTIWRVLHTSGDHGRPRRGLVLSLTGFASASLALLLGGAVLILDDRSAVGQTLVAGALVALLATGVHQAWMLVGGQPQSMISHALASTANRRERGS